MNKKRTEALSAIFRLEGIPSVIARRAAEIAVSNGYRKEWLSEWQRDDSYAGKCKVIYRCKNCDHYEAIAKGDKKLRYMNYCASCGAKMQNGEGEDDET